MVAHDAAVHVAEIPVEAGVPLSHAFDVIAVQIAHVLDRAAKTGRADHRAIRARQAARRHFRPARMFQVVEQQVANVGRVEPLGDLVDRLLPRGLGVRQVARRSAVVVGKLGQRSPRRAGCRPRP